MLQGDVELVQHRVSDERRHLLDGTLHTSLCVHLPCNDTSELIEDFDTGWFGHETESAGQSFSAVRAHRQFRHPHNRGSRTTNANLLRLPVQLDALLTCTTRCTTLRSYLRIRPLWVSARRPPCALIRSGQRAGLQSIPA